MVDLATDCLIIAYRSGSIEVGEEIKTWKSADGNTHSGALVKGVSGFDVIECSECGFKHIIPLPSMDDLIKVYSHEYYKTDKPFYIESYLRDKEWWDLVYSERYEELELHLSRDHRRILDIGSGPGLFLLHGKGRGWDVVGVEPSTQAAAYSREVLGLEVFEAFLNEETAKKVGKFDAVSMALVLEHVPDPKGMLLLVNSMLNDSGVICVVVPNDFNPIQMALNDSCGFEPWWIAPPHHLNYFNFDSLRSLLSGSGFEYISHTTSFPIDMFLLMGDNYVGNDALGKECHARRKRFELSLVGAGYGEIKSKLYKAMADMGLGREVVMFARKIPD